MIFVKGVVGDTQYYYHIHQDNHMYVSMPLDAELENFVLVSVRVLAKTGKKWLLDPSPTVGHLWDALWLYSNKSMARMMWDPGGWY